MGFLSNIADKFKGDKAEQGIAEAIKANKVYAKEFEEAYERASFSKLSEGNYVLNAKQMSAEKAREQGIKGADGAVIDRIVDELLAQTEVYSYEGRGTPILKSYKSALPDGEIMTPKDIECIAEGERPQLTGYYMMDVIPGTGKTLIELWKEYVAEKDSKKGAAIYNHFRQGLDILDIDGIVYEMINRNPNSMGNWLPYMIEGIEEEGFFKVPKTKIIKVPMSLLQLTRLDYMEMTRATLDIVDKYCYKVFELKDDGDYFIKTGTYSSKYDFRNARVTGEKEVRELGEYLLYNHWQALQMAHYDIRGGRKPIIYGVSTTVEWVVREFIPDVEDNLTIYHGLPLRTEYRVFVDFDTKEVLGIHSYWSENVMKEHFASRMMHNTEDIDAKHDYVTYTANMERLNKRYEDNKDKVCEHIGAVLERVDGIRGQWSVDIMQNGEDFYLIDMAIAENSAYYKESVPEDKRRRSQEKWVQLPDKTSE